MTFVFFFQDVKNEFKNPNLFLYTRTNSGLHLNTVNITSSPFDHSLKTYLIVHGFIDSSNSKWVPDIKDNLLLKEDVNVIAIDWAESSTLIGNSWLPYVDAAGNTKLVGSFVAKFLSDSNINTQNVHCIGHSLGAHLCGKSFNVRVKLWLKLYFENIWIKLKVSSVEL